MASEVLASLDDINTHLPDDKARMTDADDDQFQVDTARYVRSLLAGYFDAATLVSWDSPADTPELIRGIAGRLIASQWYAKLYSEDAEAVSAYAQWLYNQANTMIDDIRSGHRIVLDSNDVPIPVTGGTSLASADFWPNDSSDPPYFNMAMKFS